MTWVMKKSNTEGAFVLFGDSAHAITPHLGAGARMAFEHAYILSNLLETLKDARDLEKIFKSF